MSDDAADLARLKREALAARARMDTSLVAVKQRLAPNALAEQAREKVRSTTNAVATKAHSTVSNNPGATAAAAGAAGLILFRKPMGKLFKALFGKEKRQRRRIRRAEKQAGKEAARTGSELPPADLLPTPAEQASLTT